MYGCGGGGDGCFDECVCFEIPQIAEDICCFVLCFSQPHSLGLIGGEGLSIMFLFSFWMLFCLPVYHVVTK